MLIVVRSGEPAPVSGTYEEIGELGHPINVRVTVRKGERLPHSPQGYFWRLVNI